MTRLAPSLALLAAVGLLAACGKSDTTASTAKHASGSSSTERVARPGTRPGGQPDGRRRARLRRVQRTEGTRIARRKAAQGEARRVRASDLDGRPSPKPARRTSSAEAGLASASVQSEVTVASSAAVAAKELALARSKRTRDCVSRYIGLLVHAQTHPGASVGAVSLVQRIPPAPGADGSFAWRISCRSPRSGITLAIYFDVFGFVSGPNEVTLFVSGVPVPPPAAGRGAPVLAVAGKDEGRREGPHPRPGGTATPTSPRS